MASNSFKVKNSLVLTPKDLSTLISPEAGDLACDINDSNKIKRYDAASASWVEVGSGGGVGGVDIFFVQDFESASLSSFTQTGLVLSQTDPLKGKVSAVLNHQAGVNQSFKQIISVDRKFRGEAMTLKLDSKSNASQGNLVISIYDETNSADIVVSEQLQLSDDVSGAKSVVSFVIPETCASISYTITALPESGKVSRIDDIICELTSVEVINSGLVQEADSTLKVNTPVRGTTSTGVYNFTNVQTSIGSDVVLQQSATLGSTFTIQTTGVYALSFSLVSSLTNSQSASVGISRNQTSAGTTAAENLNSTEILASSRDTDVAGGAAKFPSTSWTGLLNAGDIIRFHGNPADVAVATSSTATISRQGSLKQVSVNPNSKITIPTSELRMEGASTRGSTATAIVRFDNVAKLRGDAFTVESDSVLGTRITMKKAGKLDVSYSIYSTAANQQLAITKNSSTLVLATVFNVASELLSTEYTAGTADVLSASYSGFVSVGDIIRIAANTAITSNPSNNLNLAFQEQEIQVSVSNTLPQFSESDSSVRVDTANGYGSTATKIRRFSNLTLNSGTDIEYADSATNGASFTIKADGVYEMSYSDNLTTVGYIGLSKNAASLTTGIQSITDSTALAYQHQAINNSVVTVSYVGSFVAGDIIRVHNDGVAASSNAYARFTISKVGKPNVTGVDVTPFVNVPQQERQSSVLFNATSIAASNYITGSLQSSINSGLYSYNSSTGFYTILKKCKITMSYSARSSSTTAARLGILVDGNGVAFSHTSAALNIFSNVTTTIELNPGQFIAAFVDGGASNNHYVNVVAEALSDQILTAPETFSTDTASLTYASSSLYTLSTLANAPVGTYITFTYAANTNTRTQTTTRPTQTDADMNANGILIYTRAFNAASTAAQSSQIAIQIGKGLKGVSVNGYSASGKTSFINLDSSVASSTIEYGLSYRDYNEVTGILIIDAGQAKLGTNTSRIFQTDNNGTTTSGYLVINASKSPALTGVPLLQPRIATLSDVKASGTSGGTATSGSYQTRTLNTLSDPTGIVTSLASNQFTLPAGEYYIEAEAPALGVEHHKIKLRNVTNSSDQFIGSSEYSSSAATYAVTKSSVKGTIVISVPTTFELQHRVATTRATNGFGANSAFGDNEMYSTVKITKVK